MAAPKHQTAPVTEKRVRLAITGKTEDLPRLLTAYTRIAKVGEFALVLKPRSRPASTRSRPPRVPSSTSRRPAPTGPTPPR